jgi:RNA polymerase sigma factor
MDIMETLKYNRDDFIKSNRNFIYGAAYSVCKRRLEWENDDELSIAIIAFNKACDTYSESKGNFYSFARIIIRNGLIDFFRSAPKETLIYFDEDENSEEQLQSRQSISSYELEIENKNRAEEILSFTMELANYKLSLENLVDSAPSHKDTRDNLLNIAFKCSREKAVTDYICKYKLLPIKQISLLTGSKPKLLEKWRKYLLVLILILTNDNYIYLRSYLDIKAGE